MADLKQKLLAICGDESLTQIGFRRDLHRLVATVKPVDLVDIVEPETITAVYIVRSVLNDLQRNIGTDASFSYPEKLVNDQGLMVHLKTFIEELLTMDRNELPAVGKSLCNGIKAYYSVLHEIDRDIDKYE